MRSSDGVESVAHVVAFRLEQNALDNFRNLVRSVASGIAHVLHDGWIHPHFIGRGRCCIDI